ncbi:MAG TPA: P1 family peptidase [Gemmatimonadaceae bacterium]
MPADFTPLGLAVGHATDENGVTGLTVVRGIDGPFRAGVALLGRATGTRELDALSPRHVVDRVDAILLTGGSAYGLAAAAGVMRWMEERGRGFRVAGGVVPIVPAAVIFDLAPLGRFDARPTAMMAYDASERATGNVIAEGSVGAGTGATVGKEVGIERAMKGGVGCALESAGSCTAGAIAVVNALGDVRDERGAIIAGARADTGGFIDIERAVAAGEITRSRTGEQPAGHTTLAVVAVNAAMSRVDVEQLAHAAGAAIHRRITPSGTSFDGDVVFSICPIDGPGAPPLQMEALATRALERAIERAVRAARGRPGAPGLAGEAA